MSVKARLKRLEQALKPPGKIISVDRYPCMTDADIEACVRQKLGREPKDGDVLMVVILQCWSDCPDELHTHVEAPEPESEPEPEVWVSGVRWSGRRVPCQARRPLAHRDG